MTTRRASAPALRRLGLVLAAVGTFGVCEPVSAESFVSARLLKLEGQEDLTCPKSERLSSTLICQVVVDETGAVNADPSTRCFGNPGEDVSRADILRRKFLRSRFEPARIDGEGVPIYASFRVLFQDTDGHCDVTVFPNLAIQQDETARNYIPPQEIFTEGGWLQPLWGTFRREDFGGLDFRGIAFVMSVAVDELGNASDGRVEQNNFASEETVQRAVESLEQQRFIPATLDGVVRPARYFEFMFFEAPPRRRLR